MNEGQYRVALEKEIETNAGLLRSYMTIILFIILETGWGNRSEDSVGAGRLPAAGDHIHTLYMCACACVCVYVSMLVECLIITIKAEAHGSVFNKFFNSKLMTTYFSDIDSILM